MAETTSPKPSPSPQAGVSSKKTTSKTTTPEQDAQVGIDTANDAPGGKKGVLGILGVPLGTQVQVGITEQSYTGTPSQARPIYAKTQYAIDSPYTIVMSLSAQDRANLLARLGTIPGLYAKGQAPTLDYIKATQD